MFDILIQLFHFKNSLTSFVDPDPNWNRTYLATLWIGIRIQDTDLDPEPHRLTSKNRIKG